MFYVGFTVGAIIGANLALILHCLIIVGKESDKDWEEEKITNQEKN